MISGYGSDSTVTGLVDAYDWYFAPVLNPDGYVFTWDDVSDWILREGRLKFRAVGCKCGRD